jgi:hypothetical protein
MGRLASSVELGFEKHGMWRDACRVFLTIKVRVVHHGYL